MKAEIAGPPLASVPGLGALTLGGFAEQVCIEHAGREALVFDDPLLRRYDAAVDVRRPAA